MSQADPAAPRRQGDGSPLQVLDRTFAVLDLFTAERPTWTTTEIARATGLPIPTAHRILVTLRAHRYLTRDESTKRFRLGSAALELGDRARAADRGAEAPGLAPAGAAAPAGRDA